MLKNIKNAYLIREIPKNHCYSGNSTRSTFLGSLRGGAPMYAYNLTEFYI